MGELKATPYRVIPSISDHWISFSPAVRVEITRFWIQTMTSSPLSIRAVTWASSRLNSAGCWHEPRPSATKLWPRPRLFSIATESISVNSSQHLKKTATIELNIEKIHLHVVTLFVFHIILVFSSILPSACNRRRADLARDARTFIRSEAIEAVTIL